MCERDDSNFLGFDLVDDGVREAPERETTCRTALNGPEAWVVAEDAERALKLGDEGQSELGICFSRVEQGSVNQLALSFETDGGIHFSASRARAIASTAGTTGARPA